MVSMIERGTEYNAEIAEVMYHCTLCDACANDCVTGYKPSDFTREARTLAVVENFAPAKVFDMIDTITEKGNIFGTDRAEVIFDAVGALPEKAEVILYTGETARSVLPQAAIDVATLLKKAGVSFTILKDEPASGAYLGELMGFTGDVQLVAKTAAERIATTGAKTVIVLNPADASFMHEKYSEWGILKETEIVTGTAFLASLIQDGKLNIRKESIRASLQEPVKLTRGMDEIIPLKLIVDAAGVELVEMFLNGKLSRSVGTVPFELYDPKTVREMVRVRCNDAKRLGGQIIITVSPDDTYLMSKYAVDDIRIVDLFTLLNERC
jgi:Fe-S oxidoreductase